MLMDKNYSTQAFFDFLIELPKLGLINESTARNLKNSALLLLSVIDWSEDDDVRDIDVDELITRYVETQANKPSDSTVHNYRSRFKSAVNKFEEYVRVGTIVNLADTEGNLSGFDAVEQKIEKAKLSKGDKTQAFNLPIVVRPETGTLITVQGLPTDLTAEEAERIFTVLKAYVRS
ncbi:TPA: hypothetical protein LR368_003940 [Enterobacter hormaechei]|nr:hypothetical protein [Enterobacter hormaechei]OAH39163.1 hypothetical protein AYJ11_09545 [Enterobacter hormaechei subsp. xiangfangensis]HBL5495870.1 hypothetical protein [Enterobacter hormaechei]HBL9093841.1 hypothetical protein [Enterobacter hormaechei]HBL9195549.1 hypothetical protein [Enterobacter hormaechei]